MRSPLPRWLAPTALLASVACSDAVNLLSDPDQQELVPRDRLAIHLHVLDATANDVDEVFEVAALARTQAPADVADQVGDIIAASSPLARWLVVLGDPVDLSIVERFADDPRVVGWQLENEPNNLEPGFLGWTPQQYAAWLREVAPQVRARKGRDQLIVSAATTPIWDLWPTVYEWNLEFLAEEALFEVDVWAMHVYGSSFSRLPDVREIHDVAVEMTNGRVWVTEFGHPDDAEEVDYAKQLPAALALGGIVPERWSWYAWNDHELGFALEDESGQASPLLTELRNREQVIVGRR